MESFYHKSIFYHSPKQTRHRKLQPPAARAPWVVWQSGGRNCPNIHRHSLRNCWWSSQTSASEVVCVCLGWVETPGWEPFPSCTGRWCWLRKKTLFQVYFYKKSAIQIVWQRMGFIGFWMGLFVILKKVAGFDGFRQHGWSIQCR